MPDKTASASEPQIIVIGLPFSGDTVVAALFKANGYEWRHNSGGKLAQDLAYAQAQNLCPFKDLGDIVGVSGIHRMNKRHFAPLGVQNHLEYLRDWFPNAYFIHTRRATADWIADRFWTEDGAHRTAAAWHAGVTEADLPALWMEQHATYEHHANEIFARHSRYLSINLSSEPIEILIDFLSSGFEFKIRKALPSLRVSAEHIDNVVTYIDQLPSQAETPPADITFTRQVADFCAQTKGHSGKKIKLSRTAVTWERNGSITDRSGEILPVARREDGGFMFPPGASTFDRAEATLNEMVQHGARRPLHIDMMDARFLGTPERRNPPVRTVAYNRRNGAQNFTLWPLLGYHSLAPTGSVGGFPRDEIAFENKEDRCVWFGNMTGRMSDILAPDDSKKRSVYALRDQAEALEPDSTDWPNLIKDFMCVPRYNIVQTYRNHPDFNVGLVLRARWKRLATSPVFAGLCDPIQPRSLFHKYRYTLSLAGNDTGSNFLSAASSNSLILKEEDGWELFYTDAFKPWIHYVPLAEGAQDVEEKLAWARAHPDKSKAMVVASTELFDKFANPNNRRAILTAITADLNADLD